jgi:hypothetical protein
MTRRAVLLAALAGMARADSADQTWDLIGAMASALSENNAPEFLHPFDSAMPGYQHLNDAVTAIARDYTIEVAVDLVSNEGNDAARTLETDWKLGFALDGDMTSLVRRNERITFKLEKKDKHWRIVSLDPPSAFDPPKP